MEEISSDTWHGLAAIRLEGERVRLVIVPELGAKIVSLFDMEHGYEWLVPPMRPLKPAQYGADFVSQDMSGWDEMLPTITACEVDGYQYPDHGEVWSIPWQVTRTGSGITATVNGVARPYAFTRLAALKTPDTLELTYHLKNTGTAPMPYLWAAHPQFLAEESTRIVFPKEAAQVINVVADDPAWGAVGAAYPWPVAQDRDGQTWQLDRVRPVDSHACRKFYLPPERPVGWTALVQGARSCQLKMSWSTEELPYLGLWVDEGTYNRLPVAAPEPSNGYYDGLEKAIANQRVTVLAPGEESEWRLRVQLSGIDPDLS
jgi:galactose mutarotase-like enzyme